MCFGGGDRGVDQVAVAKNREIEKVIRADQKKAAREVKLLLLGEQSPLHKISSCKFSIAFSLPISAIQLLGDFS